MTREEALEAARQTVSIDRNCDNHCMHSKRCELDYEERQLEAIGWEEADSPLDGDRERFPRGT